MDVSDDKKSEADIENRSQLAPNEVGYETGGYLVIVCLCHAIPEKKLRDVIQSGARTLKDVQKRCGAGTDCGSCVREVEEMLRAEGAGAAQCAPASRTQKE